MCRFQISDVQMILSEPRFIRLRDYHGHNRNQNPKNLKNLLNPGSDNIASKNLKILAISLIICNLPLKSKTIKKSSAHLKSAHLI
jgi:hypothetical protein